MAVMRCDAMRCDGLMWVWETPNFFVGFLPLRVICEVAGEFGIGGVGKGGGVWGGWREKHAFRLGALDNCGKRGLFEEEKRMNG